MNLFLAKRIWIKTDEQEEWLKGSRQKFPSRAFYNFALYPGSFAETNEMYRFLAARVPAKKSKPAQTARSRTERLPGWSKSFVIQLIAFILWIPSAFVLFLLTGMWPGYAIMPKIT